MRRMFMFAILSVILMFGGVSASTALPWDKNHEVVIDVGKVCPSFVYVNVVNVITELTVPAQDVGPAIMPVIYTYKKKKFESFNSKFNRWHRQKFGQDANMQIQTITINEKLPPIDNDIDKPAWQEYASIVKDQA